MIIDEQLRTLREKANLTGNKKNIISHSNLITNETARNLY